MTEQAPAQNRTRRRSRYDHPRRIISWTGLLLGLILGLVGGLVVTRTIAPAEEVNTTPRQLRPDDKAQYVVAIMVNYAYDGDLMSAVQRLIELDLGADPINAVAEIACQLASRGYARSTSGERAIRSMIALYQSQGRAGCADELLPPVSEPTLTVVVVASTPTIPPPPTKTPTPEGQIAPTPTPNVAAVPTVPPQRAFELIRLEPICDENIPGRIEVYVRQRNGSAIPGQRVRVRWEGGESIFLTGMSPLRGLDYADFDMEPNVGYRVDLPGQSDPTSPILAATCTDPTTNQPTTQSWYVVFVPAVEQ